MTLREEFIDNKQSLGELDFSVRLMEHLVVPTFVLDAECRVIIWNKACERLTGIPAAELIGTREHWRAFYDAPRPCLADLICQGRTEEIDKLYAAHDVAGSPEVKVHGRKAENWCVMPQVGTQLYLAIDAGPIYDESGRLVAVVETLRDMTAQKLAQDELQRLATRDGLTSVANRRSFDDTLNMEWRRASRDSRSLSLLMIDVDYFKRYNDTYGHQTGDQCLKAVADALASAVGRTSDIVARYGGEEFVVVLPDTSVGGILFVAEKLRHGVHCLAIPHSASERGFVTISVGIASAVPTRGLTPAALIDRADRALYRAKQGGRDRVCRFDPDLDQPA